MADREVSPIRGDDLVVSLEKLIYDNPDLERLESILDDFNPFEAMRWTVQETRHSAFLRWILDPSETHGLGGYFLKAFAKRLASRSAGLHPLAPSVFDVDSWSLQSTEVLQEWNSIDVLAKDDEDGFVLVIENKVGAAEHSGQLQRYRQLAEREFPEHKRLFALLSPDQTAPTDELYVAIDYGEVVGLIDETLERRGDQMGDEVRNFLSQYSEMVRRNIMEDSEIQRLCHRIYEKHRRALDVIFEHRPDRISEVSEMLQQVLRNRSDVAVDHCTKAYVRFIPLSLDFFPRTAQGWTPSKRMLLFEFDNYQRLNLRLTLGPAPQDLRQRVHAVVQQNAEVFNRARQKFYSQYWSLHGSSWVSADRYTQLPIDELRSVVEKNLERLMTEEVPKMVRALEPLRGLTDLDESRGRGPGVSVDHESVSERKGG